MAERLMRNCSAGPAPNPNHYVLSIKKRLNSSSLSVCGSSVYRLTDRCT
jgi:hypothetical protein